MQFIIRPSNMEEVLHIKACDQTDWQKDYGIQDIYDRSKVFVPATRDIKCKLFRMNHAATNPTHWLFQLDAGACVWCPLRPIRPLEEATFNYFGGGEDTQSSSQSVSQSLSSLSGSPIDLTGNGKTTTARLMRGFEERQRELNGEDKCARLAFDYFRIPEAEAGAKETHEDGELD